MVASSTASLSSSSSSAQTNAATAMQSLQMRERFLQLVLTMVGQRVVLTQTNGSVLEGVLHTFTPFASQPAKTKNKYVLKAVHVVTDKGGERIKKGGTVIVGVEKVVSVYVKSMRIGTNGKEGGAGFRTDTEISKKAGGKTRELVEAGSAWTSGGGAAIAGGASSKSRADGLLDKQAARRAGPGPAANATGPLRGKIGKWDQFQANEDLFDVHASYDENLYTTALDKSSIDSSKLKAAERLAREIEGSESSNIHVAEERGQDVQGDYDEEDRYSGVLRPNVQPRNKPPPMNYARAAIAASKNTRQPQPPAPQSKPPAGGTGPPGFRKDGKPAAPIAATTTTGATQATSGAKVRPETSKTKESDANKKDTKRTTKATNKAGPGRAATTTTTTASTSPPTTKTAEKTTNDKGASAAAAAGESKAKNSAPTTSSKESDAAAAAAAAATTTSATSKSEGKAGATTTRATTSSNAKTSKPDNSSTDGKDKKDATTAESTKEKAPPSAWSSAESKDKKTETKADGVKDDSTEPKAPSKLNANAKAFTLNANAVSFKPTFGGPSTVPADVPVVDPNALMPQQPFIPVQPGESIYTTRTTNTHACFVGSFLLFPTKNAYRLVFVNRFSLTISFLDCAMFSRFLHIPQACP